VPEKAALQRAAGGPRGADTAYAGATHGDVRPTMIKLGRSSDTRPVKVDKAARIAHSAVRHNHASPRPSSQAVATVAAIWAMIMIQLAVAASAIGPVLCTLIGPVPCMAHAAPSW